MRDLARNRRPVYYALFLGDTPMVDEKGHETGETQPSYSDAVKALVNLSPASGEEKNQVFGGFTDYSHTIVTARPFPFDEYTILWVDTPTDGPHNYAVVRVAASLNGWAYALRAVVVDG